MPLLQYPRHPQPCAAVFLAGKKSSTGNQRIRRTPCLIPGSQMWFFQIIKICLNTPYFLIIPGETISRFSFLFHLPIAVFIMHDNRILNCVLRNRKTYIIYFFRIFFKSIICFNTSPRFIISILCDTHTFGNNVCASTSEITDLFRHCSPISPIGTIRS